MPRGASIFRDHEIPGNRIPDGGIYREEAASSPALAAIVNRLVSKVASTANSVRSGRHEEMVVWPTGLAPGICAPAADLVVPLQHTGTVWHARSITIRTATTPANGKRDFDKLKLIFRPAP